MNMEEQLCPSLATLSHFWPSSAFELEPLGSSIELVSRAAGPIDDCY